MGKQANVLVIDNDVMALEALRLELGNNGVVVEAHADAAEAFRALAGGRFDVVVSALTVPRAGGLGVLNRVQQCDPALPLIVLADHASEPAALEAVKRGAFDYVRKPFPPGKVAALVARALEVRRLREEVKRLRAERENQTSR